MVSISTHTGTEQGKPSQYSPIWKNIEHGLKKKRTKIMRMKITQRNKREPALFCHHSSQYARRFHPSEHNSSVHHRKKCPSNTPPADVTSGTPIVRILARISACKDSLVSRSATTFASSSVDFFNSSKSFRSSSTSVANRASNSPCNRTCSVSVICC